MKKRITTEWNWMRIAFLFMGVWMMIQTAIEGEWLGMILGAGLAVMGVFSLGCASGNCYTGDCSVKPDDDHKI